MNFVWYPLAQAVNAFCDRYSPHSPTANVASSPPNRRITIIQYAKYVSLQYSQRHKRHPRLDPDFDYEHLDQSCDNIFLAFQTLSRYINKRRANAPSCSSSPPLQFIVCYIADGGDTENGKYLNERLQSLSNFDSKGVQLTTIAIGGHFPSNTMMIIRSIFHDPNSIALSLLTKIDYDDDFQSCFDLVVPHLLGNTSVAVPIKPSVKRAPWLNTTTNSVTLGAWYILDDCDSQTQLLLATDAVPIVDVSLTPQNLLEIGRQWVRDLQTGLMCGVTGKEEARIALQFITRLKNGAASYRDLQKRSDKSVASTAKKTKFTQRLRAKEQRSEMYEMQTIVNEIREMGMVGLSDLDDEQLAKRLAIGTRESKLLDKAIRLKGILTASEFYQAKNQFRDILLPQLELLRRCAKSDPCRSAVTLETNIDVLTDSGFLDCLFHPTVSSQYNLIECMPVVGLSLKAHIPQGAIINPWLVRVDSVSRVTPYLDSSTLLELKGDDGIAILPCGLEENELVSVVCPLLTPHTSAALAPIFSSKLYQILMTYQTTQNVDTLHKSSHMALLASLLAFLVADTESHWRDDLLDTVTFTAMSIIRHAVHGKAGNTYLDVLSRTPQYALVTYHKTLPKTCECISKALIAVAVLLRDRNDNDIEWDELWEKLVLEYIGRAVLSDDPTRRWDKWFTINSLETLSEVAFEDIFGHDGSSKAEMAKYASLPAIGRAVQAFKGAFDMVTISAGKLQVNWKRLEKANAASNGPVKWRTLVGFEKKYMGGLAVTADEKKITSFVSHALQTNGSYERMFTAAEPWSESLESGIQEEIMRICHKKAIRSAKKALELDAQERLRVHMCAMHQGVVLPMSLAEVKKMRFERYGLETSDEDVKELKYDAVSGLCRRACQSASCERFLIADKRFHEHLENCSPVGGKPIIAMHRTVQQHHDKSLNEIEGLIISGACWRRTDRKSVRNVGRQDYLAIYREHIATLREVYRTFGNSQLDGMMIE